MKFEINNMNYEIIEVSIDDLREIYLKDFPDSERKLIYGYCCYTKHQILINKDIHKEEKIRALKHELTHCYLWNTSKSFEEYDEEIVCNIMADGMDIIYEIVKEYKKHL